MTGLVHLITLVIISYKPGATFSKLLRKILGRYLFLGKDPHFRNFLGRSCYEDLSKKILGKCSFSKLLWKYFRENVGKYVGKHQPFLI